MQSKPMKNQFFKSNKRKRFSVAILFTTIMITVLTFAIYEGTKKTVTLQANGKTEEIKTHAKTVSDLLAAEEIQVAKHDVVTPSLDAEIEDGLAVDWKQAEEVAIVVDNEKSTVWTTEKTVSKVLDEAGIDITEHDQVTPALPEELDEKNRINVDKAYQFTVVDGGKKKKYWSTSTTIGEFLNKENIQLSKLDKLSDKKKATIKPNATVEIVRVKKETKKVESAKDFAVEKKNDDNLLKGQEKVVQKGKKGVIEQEYEIVKENGKEVSRSLVAEKTVTKPEKQIVSVGTKVVVAAAETPASQAVSNPKKEAQQPKAQTKKPAQQAKKPSPSTSKAPAKPKPQPKPQKQENTTVSRGDSAPSGGKEFYVTATAYTAGCNGCSGITATGINLKANPNLKVIAVDPSVIPLGSKVWVEGYGNAIAGDTGGAIKGNRIDLHVPTKEQAYSFGHRKVKIKILN